MATSKEEIYAAIRNADAAGDSEAVRKLGAYLQTMQEAPSEEPTVSPFPYKPYKRMNERLGKDGRPIREEIDETPEHYKKAAAAGVDITTGGPDRTKASFAGRPEDRMAFYQKRFGEDNVRKGPESGLLEYKEGDGRWTTIDPMGSMNPGAHLGAVVEAVPSILGGIGGAALGAPSGPGAAAAGVAGATGGAYAGKTLRNFIGQKIGAVDPEAKVTEGAGTVAKDTAKWEAISLGVLGAGKGAYAWFKGGKVLTADEAAELLKGQEGAQRIIDEVKATSGLDFKPTTAQVALSEASGMRNTKTAVLAARAQGMAEKDPDIGIELELLQRKNEEALKGHFDALLGNARQQAVEKTQAGQAVAAAIIDPYTVARQAALEQIERLPAEVSDEQAATILNQAIVAAKDDYSKNITRPAWKQVDDMMGFDAQTFKSKIKLPYSDAAKNLEKAFTAEERAVIEAFGSRELDATPRISIPKDKHTPAFHEWSLSKTEAPTVDLAVLNQEIRDVRATLRAKNTGDTSIKIDAYKLTKLESTLTKMRDDYLAANHPELKDALDAAEAKSAMGVQKFDRGISKDMLVMDRTGGPRLTQASTLAKLLRDRDPVDLKQFADNVKAHPEAKQQVNQLLLALYRRDYTKNGVPTPSLHQKFLDDETGYGRVLKAFFNEQDMSTVRRVGGLGEIVTREADQLKRLKLAFKETLGGEFEHISPEDFINKVASGTIKPAKMGRLLETIQKSPYSETVLSKWRAGVAEELHKKIVGKDGYINAAGLERFLAGDGAASVQRLFSAGERQYGHRLIKGLETLRDAHRLISVKSIRNLDPSVQTAWTQLSRITYAPPLSREGLFVSFGQRSRRVAAPEKIYKMLTDPDELTKLITQARPLLRQIQTAVGTGAVIAAEDDY